MKVIYQVIAKGLFVAFIVAVFLWTASLTLAEVREILPNDPLTPYFALALFDGGAVAWLGAWLYHARGIYQRAISLFMMVIDLLGVILLAAGRLIGGGQSMIESPEGLGAAVVYGVVGATLLNLAAVYFFHTTDPDTIEDIETSILEDTLRDEALTQAKAAIQNEARQLGGILAARATGRLKYKLRLPMRNDEVNAITAADLDAIDLQTAAAAAPAADQGRQIIPAMLAQPAKPKTKPNQRGKVIAAWIASAARKAGALLKPNPKPAGMATFESSAADALQGINITPKPSPADPAAANSEITAKAQGGDGNFTQPSQGSPSE